MSSRWYVTPILHLPFLPQCPCHHFTEIRGESHQRGGSCRIATECSSLLHYVGVSQNGDGITKMRWITTILLVTGAQFFASDSKSGWWGPSTYEECILENMKGITSDHAAAAVQAACRKKFPEKAQTGTSGSTGESCQNPRKLSISELAEVKVQNFRSYKRLIDIDFHNGNSKLYIKSLVFVLYDTLGDSVEKHAEDVYVSPQSSSSSNFLSNFAMNHKNWSVYIESGKACAV